MQFLKALASVITSELVPVLSRTASAVSAAFDISAYEDLVEIQLHAGAATAGTTPTLDVKVTHCVASDGVYADVSNAAFTRVTTVAGVQTLVYVKIGQSKAVRHIRAFQVQCYYVALVHGYCPGGKRPLLCLNRELLCLACSA